MKKIWIIYLLCVALGASGFTYMVNSVSNPEKRIVGEWKEKSWEYEKVHRKADVSNFEDTISDKVKEQLGKHLMIHTAETWCFHPDGTLILKGNNTEKTVAWRLKGRGHVLQLRHDNGITEHYNLTELGDNQMVLNYDSDMQVRGIAKLTFEK